MLWQKPVLWKAPRGGEEAGAGGPRAETGRAAAGRAGSGTDGARQNASPLHGSHLLVLTKDAHSKRKIDFRKFDPL